MPSTKSLSTSHELEADGERVLRVTSAQLKQPRLFLARLRAAGVPEA
jgi:hypothetical protein